MLFDISSRVPGRAFELFVDGQPLESAEPLIRLALEIQWPLCVRRVAVRPFSFVVNVRGPNGAIHFNADAVMASAVTSAVYSAGVSFNVTSVTPSIRIGLDAIQFTMELHGPCLSGWRDRAEGAAIEREQLREQRVQSMALAEQATAKLAEVRAERDEAKAAYENAVAWWHKVAEERDATARALSDARQQALDQIAKYRAIVAEGERAKGERGGLVNRLEQMARRLAVLEAEREEAEIAAGARVQLERDLAIAKAGWEFQVEKRGKERESLSNALATLQAAMAENQALQARIDALRAERDVAQAELNGIRSLLADNYWLQNASTGWRIDYWLGEESPWRALFGDEQRGILDERQFVTLPEAVAWLEATGREAQAEAERAAVVGE